MKTVIYRGTFRGGKFQFEFPADDETSILAFMEIALQKDMFITEMLYA